VSASITKDRSIWRLVAELAKRFDAHRFQIIDHWDADLFAIGIARTTEPRRLVYVSTYRQPAGSYSFQCEGAAGTLQENAQADVATFDELVDCLRKHLAIDDVTSKVES
jgi:hypothetical protein